MSVSTSLLQPEFLKPRYWLTWVGIAFVRLVCALPLRTRWNIGSWLGTLGYRFAKKRRHIVATNLKLCFPDLDADELEQLVIRTFESSGISIIETALVWLTPLEKYKSLVDIHGLIHLKEARKEGRGVLLLGMHLSSLDFCGAVLATHTPFDVMYRYNKNSLLEAVMTRGRERNFPSAIERNNIRGVIKRLKQGAIVWYGPDQDYGRKHSVFAPFFGVPAASITATSRITRMTGCAVVAFSHYRNLSTGRYDIFLDKPLEDFPKDDELADCTRINQIVEEAIAKHPEQYWWLHRRFKTRPDGEPRPYDV